MRELARSIGWGLLCCTVAGCARSSEPFRVELKEASFFVSQDSAPRAWDPHNYFSAFPRRTGDSIHIRVAATYHQPKADGEYFLTCRARSARDSLVTSGTRRVLLRADSSDGAWVVKVSPPGSAGWWPAAEYEVTCDLADARVTNRFRVEGGRTDSIWHGPANLAGPPETGHRKLLQSEIRGAVVFSRLWADDLVSPGTTDPPDQSGPFDSGTLSYVHLLISFGNARLPDDLTMACAVQAGGSSRPTRASRVVAQRGDYVLLTSSVADVGKWRPGTWRIGCAELGDKVFVVK